MPLPRIKLQPFIVCCNDLSWLLPFMLYTLSVSPCPLGQLFFTASTAKVDRSIRNAITLYTRSISLLLSSARRWWSDRIMDRVLRDETNRLHCWLHYTERLNSRRMAQLLCFKIAMQETSKTHSLINSWINFISHLKPQRILFIRDSPLLLSRASW